MIIPYLLRQRLCHGLGTLLARVVEQAVLGLLVVPLHVAVVVR